MNYKFLSMSRRIRKTPFTQRVEAAGVKSYTSYNHMLLPTVFDNLEADYWHLCEHVQVWDVSCERQVEIKGPDSQRLVQLMTPRDVSRAQELQCFYVPLCDEKGGIINDPIAIKLARDHWWLSIADSDVILWAMGLASGFGFDVEIREPDIWPLAVQGPKAEQLMMSVFGDEVSSIRFFRGKMMNYRGQEMLVTRSGWSKQGGFEIYLINRNLAEPLWDELFEQGQNLNVRAGCPNLIERIESGLLSFGNDITTENNPFECGLDTFINLDADIESLSHNALRALDIKKQDRLMGLAFNQPMEFESLHILSGDKNVGEITSHVWSPKQGKHLAFAMMKRFFIDHQSDVEINGMAGHICELPFNFDCMNTTSGIIK